MDKVDCPPAWVTKDVMFCVSGVWFRIVEVIMSGPLSEMAVVRTTEMSSFPGWVVASASPRESSRVEDVEWLFLPERVTIDGIISVIPGETVWVVCCSSVRVMNETVVCGSEERRVGEVTKSGKIVEIVEVGVPEVGTLSI